MIFKCVIPDNVATKFPEYDGYAREWIEHHHFSGPQWYQTLGRWPHGTCTRDQSPITEFD